MPNQQYQREQTPGLQAAPAPAPQPAQPGPSPFGQLGQQHQPPMHPLGQPGGLGQGMGGGRFAPQGQFGPPNGMFAPPAFGQRHQRPQQVQEKPVPQFGSAPMQLPAPPPQAAPPQQSFIPEWLGGPPQPATQPTPPPMLGAMGGAAEEQPGQRPAMGGFNFGGPRGGPLTRSTY